MMSSPRCPNLLDGQLESTRYAPRWAPVEKLLAIWSVEGQDVFLVTSSPWDGGPRGRIGFVARHTPARQRRRVADFLKGSPPLLSVAAEAPNPCSGM